ncbi:MAG: MBL fold metallo-hydrolase [Lactobacillaceae bacterium]|jgi:phosphoribosyl 1,2-cyclic phosphate phosphodiesterase|nr:MBL fold metallo-hydrolase [Lactobacillaceae bacterium]
MNYKLIILGSGAAPGVPSLSGGWLACNPDNPKNKRNRTSTYLEYKNTKILIDTSPDIRYQLIDNNIKDLDAVLFTHVHADHLLGIDYLREINRIQSKGINFYSGPRNMVEIEKRFDYLIGHVKRPEDYILIPSLLPHIIHPYEPFYINDLKITPIIMFDHSPESYGFVFNDGDIVYFSDFRKIDEKAFDMWKKQPELLIIPLTNPKAQITHAGFETVMQYIDKVNAKRVIINHMAGECDYDDINKRTPDNVEPAYDNMIIEF